MDHAAARAVSGVAQRDFNLRDFGENLFFRNLHVVGRRDVRITGARGIHFENVSLTIWEAPELMTLTNTRDVSIRNLGWAEGTNTIVVAKGTSAAIRLSATDVARVRTPFRLEPGAPGGAVELEPARK